MSKKDPFTEKRPWGEFRQFASGEAVTVKIITVKHGESFSLQYHQKREEFWRILKGMPEVIIGETSTHARPGDEFTVPVAVSHRVSALNDDVEFLEIARGDFDENDIVRIEDKYGRS
ncbi:MAG: phosphomannose isomerase type II C-terminal cupin domain [Patescibacteria group bacterium]